MRSQFIRVVCRARILWRFSSKLAFVALDRSHVEADIYGASGDAIRGRFLRYLDCGQLTSFNTRNITNPTPAAARSKSSDDAAPTAAR